jgi:hypothetical protein
VSRAVRSRLKRKLDYSDLKVTPDDGKRYELVRGELLVTPSPTSTVDRSQKSSTRRSTSS